MKKRILILLLVLCASFFSLTAGSIEFNLMLRKVGSTSLNFFSADGAEISSIDNLISTNNVSPEDVTFYVDYVVSNDIMNFDNDLFKVLLTFSASGNLNNESDWMLSHSTEPNTGLVFDYQVYKSTNEESTNEESTSEEILKEKSFLDEKEKISQKIGLDVRQIELFSRTENDPLPVTGHHKVFLSIYPPLSTDEKGNEIEAFTSGQYVGYVILSIVGI